MPSRMTDKELLDLAVRLVGLAAVEILEVQKAGFAVDEKADHSPVTIADMRAEKVITAGLRQATPDIPVIASPRPPRMRFMPASSARAPGKSSAASGTRSRPGPRRRRA
jgi:hypothetical protein